jgi:hypothetical protein
MFSSKRQFRVSLLDASGTRLPQFKHEGTTYVVAALGTEFTLRVNSFNKDPGQLRASVNGDDVQMWYNCPAHHPAGKKSQICNFYGWPTNGKLTRYKRFRTEEPATASVTGGGGSGGSAHAVSNRNGEICLRLFAAKETTTEVVLPRSMPEICPTEFMNCPDVKFYKQPVGHRLSLLATA